MEDKFRRTGVSRTALVTDSIAARALLKALTWLRGNDLQIFSGGEFAKALRFIECTQEEEIKIRDALLKARDIVQLKTLR